MIAMSLQLFQQQVIDAQNTIIGQAVRVLILALVVKQHAVVTPTLWLHSCVKHLLKHAQHSVHANALLHEPKHHR